jgi:hypothetical protein
VEPATNTKQALAWSRFQSYLKSIAITSDPYLDSFTSIQKIKILGAFAHALREGRFNKNKKFTPRSESIRATIDCVAQAYRLANRPDPRLDRDGKSSFLLQCQIRGYKKLDPSKKQQVALTGSILRELHKMAFTPLEKALCELFTGAFFFAMRSCKYLKVSGERRTKIIQLQNIRFFKGKREVSHSDPTLSSSSTVSITFVLQKKEEKFDTVTHHRSNHSFICPVITWARIVQRIRRYPNSTDSMTVNT